MSIETTITMPKRDWWVTAGMLIAAASAAVASFTGLRGLALETGWPTRMAWLLPVTLDGYAMTAARVWLAGTTPSRKARRFARANAVGAIAASIAGNAAFHAITAGLLRPTSPIVVLVGAVPAAVLGLTAHLHALRTLDEGPNSPDSGARSDREQSETPEQSGTESGTGNPSKTRTRNGKGRQSKYRTEDELMTAALAADQAYRAEHDGRPITRDALRSALKIAGPRATELRRRLAAADAQSERSGEQLDQTDTPDRKEALTTQ